MNIKRLNLPKDAKPWREKSCCRIIRTEGKHKFKHRNIRCGRMARFKVNGIALCTQHAGEASLYYLLNNQQDKGYAA
ncbi:hypothetical protein ACJJIU_03505 [Microbulbifer sp. CnH-101-E]|uniref:hypothetical protein n=1 Tax=unclassified Microbulbifer TaxID=2619833 RepID=UPI004039C3CE